MFARHRGTFEIQRFVHAENRGILGVACFAQAEACGSRLMMKLIRRQKVWLTIVVATNLILWIVPSDVVEQIARDRQTMLGRYSQTHFAWIVAVALLSLLSFYVDWSTGATYKKRWFRVLASLLIFVPALAAVDFLMRSPAQQHYVRDTVAYHRPVNAVFELAFEDKPEAYRTYPDAPSGFGTVTCTLHTDARGFRNQSGLQQADVVVLGDSFAEGSKVSDEHAWPRRLAEQTGLTVYNLGMSGYDPLHYRESLKEVGVALKPRFVICQLYEGNDFRSAKADRKRLHPSLSKRFEQFLGRSPAVKGLTHVLTETFGPLRAHGRVAGVEILDWLPLRIPDGPDAKFYAFAPKQLRDMVAGADTFAGDKHWLNAQQHVSEMNRLCDEAGCRLVVVFAPTKAHVTLPLVADRLPAKKVWAFTKISYRKALPSPPALLAGLVEHADAREAVVREWCARESIPFLSLTSVLRTAVLAGEQTYYTYDQHWTPTGHAVVASAIQRFMDARLQLKTGTASPQ